MKTNKMAAIFSNQHEYNELLPLTEERSLSTLYFAGKYRVMDFPLSSIVNAGVNSVYTLINQEKVRSYLDHLGGSKEWGLDTIGSYEYLDFYQKLMQKQASGNAYFDDLLNFLRTANTPYTVYIENKMIGNFDLQSVLNFHQEDGNKITAVFKRVSEDNIAPDDQLFILDEENTIMSCQQALDTQNPDRYNLDLSIYVADTKWLITELEKKLENGVVTALSASATVPETRTKALVEKPVLPKAIPDDVQQIIKNWKAMLSEAGGITRQYLNKAVPSLGAAGELMLVFDDANAYSYLNEDKAGCMTHFKQIIGERIGKDVEVTLRMNESGRSAADTVPDLRLAINFDIEEENF